MSKPPAVIAREIFVMNNRKEQIAALNNCDESIKENVRHYLNVLRERKRACDNLGYEFWL